MASSAILFGGFSLRILIEEGLQEYPFFQEPLTILFISVLFLSFGSFGRSFFSALIGEKVITDIRTKLFKKLIHLDIGFFDTMKAGEIVQNLSEDLLKIQHFFTHSLSTFIRNILLFFGALYLMFTSSPLLFIQTIGAVISIFTPLIVIGRRIKKFNKQSNEKKSHLVKLADEVFNAMKTIQAFAQEDLFIKKFDYTNKKILSFEQKRLLLRSLLVMSVIILCSFFVAIIIYFGMQQIQQNDLTTGQLVGFLYYAIFLASTLGSLPEFISEYQGVSLTIESLLKLENHSPTILNPTSPKKFQKTPQGIIAIHNVSFSYPSNTNYPVLKNLKLSLAPGERLAIVGPSGAGKSTLFSLLLRFYDPQEGVIYLDGLNIKDISLNMLRRCISIVPQEPEIFSMSAYENILYGNPEASAEDIQNIIQSLKLDEIFDKLPHGPQTLVGNRGVRLSGGQKQRIAIARALIKKPKLLLLDEATSHLDANSEQIIQKCLKNFMKQCSTIVIAHRLSTVLSCDRIAVFNNGEIEEIGTHAELISSNGLYKKLASAQFQESNRFKA